MKSLEVLVLLAVGVVLTPMSCHSEERHPHLVSARQDLRMAQAFLRLPDEPKIARNLRIAGDKIESAVGELDRAAILDSRDLDDHPVVDLTMGRRDRFFKIGELLRGALAEISGDGGDPARDRWRATVLRLIDEARSAFRSASDDAGFEVHEHASEQNHVPELMAYRL